MRSNYKKIGSYIREVNVHNSELQATTLLGINIDKYYMPSVANIVGTDMSAYKVVKQGQFACNRMHVGRDYRLPVALSKSEKDFIVSPAYDVFEIIDKTKLLPEYLMMWFCRKEFDRNAWFYTDADVRGGLPWKSFCEMDIPIPHPDKQREIVKEYNTIVNRINLNNQLIQKLEETAQAIYKRWFVDFEFPVTSPPMEGCPQDGVVKRNSRNYFDLPYNPALKDRAKALRKAGNLAEVLFWRQVRNKSFKGLDFDRQKIIGNYIVDFYCPNNQVVIEIDGSSHDNKQEYDAVRDDYLKSLGLEMIHITDTDVKNNIDSVMRFLEEHPVFNRDIDHPAFQEPLHRRGTGYKSNGGEMVECELGKEIPKGWKKCTLKDISNCLDFKRKPLSEEERNEFKGFFPYYGAMGIVDYVQEYIFDGEYLLFSEDGVNVIDEKGHPAVFLIWGKFWVNNHAHILEGKDGFSSRLIYSMLKEVNVSDIVTGAAQPKINQENLNSIILIKPDIFIAKAFDRIINPMFDIIMNKTQENQKLSKLKELLLSKLATIEN